MTIEGEAETSTGIGKLALALSKAQAVIKPAAKDKENPFFKSKYADLASVWESIREPLSANELAVIQTTEVLPSGVVLVTTLAHSSGESIVSRYPINPTKADPQGVGSAVTYARRYALAAIVGAASDDDDGEGAIDRTLKPKPAPKSWPEPKTNTIYAYNLTSFPEERLPKLTEYLERNSAHFDSNLGLWLSKRELAKLEAYKTDLPTNNQEAKEIEQ
jgi:hypothetical protein